MKRNSIFIIFLFLTFIHLLDSTRTRLNSLLKQDLKTNSKVDEYPGLSTAAYPADPKTDSNILGPEDLKKMFNSTDISTPSENSTEESNVTQPVTAQNSTDNTTSSNTNENIMMSSSNLARKENITSNMLCTNSTALHGPFPISETSKMRMTSVVILIIWGTLYLLLRLFLAFIKNNSDSFFIKALKVLAQQTLLFYICLALLVCFYTSGFLDSYGINGEYFLNGVGMFGVFWVLFCVILISVCLYHVKRFRDFEKDAKSNDFSNLKQNFETSLNSSNEKNTIYLELMEYKLLRYSFLVPLFPVFKASVLRKDFDFSKYLEISMIRILKLFFKFSWTCWILTIIIIFLWCFFTSVSSHGGLTTIVLLFPIIGLALSFVFYVYMKRIYRDSVFDIKNENYSSLIDLDNIAENNYNQEVAIGWNVHNTYIKNILGKPSTIYAPKFSIHQHFQNRAPSYYEDLILCGSTGFYLLLNFIQTLGFVFILWITILLLKHISYMVNDYSGYFLFLVIPLCVVYLALYSVLIALCIKWYTIIGSTEMKRNDKSLDKAIKYHYQISAAKSNDIFNNFKLIYLTYVRSKEGSDRLIEEGNQETITQLKENLKILIDMNIIRFKNVDRNKDKTKNTEHGNDEILIDVRTSLENYPIHVTNELRSFLKSCGNSMSEDDIKLMLKYVSHIQVNDSLTYRHFYEIWAIIIYMQKQRPDHIIDSVLNNYFSEFYNYDKENGDVKNVELNPEKIEEFMARFEEFFTEKQKEFILNEIQTLGKSFTVRELSLVLLLPRRYHPC